MAISFEQALIGVWRQVLVENFDTVVLERRRYAVRQTPKRRLREVDFVFERKRFAGLNRILKRNLGGQKWHGLERK
jgi:hypothetical protein